MSKKIARQTFYNQKYISKFKGTFLYKIIERATGSVYYAGITGNFVNRHDTGHFVATGQSEFARYVIESGRDFDEFKMQILDFSQFENDHNILAPLEKYYIKMLYGMYQEPLKNGRLYQDYIFSQYEQEEIERLKYIEQGLKWVNYDILRELYVEKHLKNRKKNSLE